MAAIGYMTSSFRLAVFKKDTLNSPMQFDFTGIPDRTGTGSLKWEKYKDTDVVPMWVADMDFKSSPAIIDALNARKDHGIYGYTQPYEEVEQAVVNYMQREHNYAMQREWLVWLPGLVPALNVACRAFGEPGDAVLTCTPVYPPFLSAPKNAYRDLQGVPLMWDGERWTFDFDALEAAVTPKTKLFLLCNPHNPVGRVFSQEELTKIVEFCARHNLILCSDEIHCDLILEGHLKHKCTATLSAEAASRTITLMAPSKTYNVPGLACSYAIIEDRRIRSYFKRAAQGMITEVNCFGYAGCAAAYNHGEPWREQLISVLAENRALLYAYISAMIPEIKLRPMEATYLAWMDVSALKLKNVADHFEKYGVGLSDGAMFGDSNYLRLNFGCPQSQLEEALARMDKAVQAIR